MKTYIYILQEPTSNQVRYVGKSNNPLRRYKSHLWDKPKVKTHCNSWIKSLQSKGLSPVFTVIDEIENDWELLEQYWIEQFKQWGFNLTNHTKGGEGAYGAGQWNNTSVTAYNNEGNFIKSFESQKACAKYFKTSQSNVRAAVSGRNLLLCKKYQICFGINTDNIGKVASYKEYEWKNKPPIHWMAKKVKCIEDDLIFNSQTEASHYYKIKVTTVNNILNGRAKKTREGKSFSYC